MTAEEAWKTFDHLRNTKDIALIKKPDETELTDPKLKLNHSTETLLACKIDPKNVMINRSLLSTTEQT